MFEDLRYQLLDPLPDDFLKILLDILYSHEEFFTEFDKLKC